MGMTAGGKPAARSPLGEAPLALEFLDALDVARLVRTEKRAVAEAAGGLWFWICARMRRRLPHAAMPRDPPSRAALQPRVLLVLLRRLHAVSTCKRCPFLPSFLPPLPLWLARLLTADVYMVVLVVWTLPDAFDVRFDAARRGGDVYLPDDGARYVSHWGATGGSMLGDRACPPRAVSYWECEGLSEGGYLGVAEVVRDGQPGFRYYGLDAQHLKRTLSLPPPACDHMPAVMYCEGGFITNGSFRGPKLRLPSRVRVLHASPFLEADRVGVVVDRVEGVIAFTRNGELQGMPIPISQSDSVGCMESSRAFFPVFSACTCYNLRLVPNAPPPWRSIYHFRDLRELLRDPPVDNSSDSDRYVDPRSIALSARGA